MNVSFESSKTLAGEGAILLLLGLLPTVGWVLGIVGIVLLLKATKELSYYYQDESIYKNSLTGLKYYIVALIAAAVLIGVGIVSFATTGLFEGNIVNISFGIIGGIVAILVGLVIAFVFYVLAASHLRKTFNTLSEKSGEHSFETAGTLLWIGSILTIIGVGLFLILVAWIFATIGFFSMKPRPYQQYTPPTNNYNNYTQPPTQPQPQATPQNGQTTV